MNGFKYIGIDVPASETLEKVTGTAIFAADMKLRNMLYGKILRSPFAHAKIRNIDISKAERLPGVKAILTREDVTGRHGPYGAAILDQNIVATEKVRYVPVAALAAVDRYVAEAAVSLIKVAYEEP